MFDLPHHPAFLLLMQERSAWKSLIKNRWTFYKFQLVILVYCGHKKFNCYLVDVLFYICRIIAVFTSTAKGGGSKSNWFGFLFVIFQTITGLLDSSLKEISSEKEIILSQFYYLFKFYLKFGNCKPLNSYMCLNCI